MIGCAVKLSGFAALWAFGNFVSRSSAVEAEVVVSAAFLLLVGKGLELLVLHAIDVHGGRSRGSGVELALWRRSGARRSLDWRSGMTSLIHLALVNAVVEADGKLRELLDGFGVLTGQGQGVFDFRLEARVILGAQGFVVPVKIGAQTEEGGGVACGGTSLEEALELACDRAILVRVAKVALKLVGEAGQAEEQRVVVALQVGLEPGEGGAAEIGSGEDDFAALVGGQSGVARDVEPKV